jgi:hypothetical protein
MDWQRAKEQAVLWFNRAAQFWLLQTVLFYVWACMVAGAPVGPKDYVRFTYHVIQWHPGQASSYLSERF